MNVLSAEDISKTSDSSTVLNKEAVLTWHVLVLCPAADAFMASP